MMLPAKYIQRGLLTVAVLMTLSLSMAQAQWGLGASYEMRNEDPENGYGVRIERTLGLPLPLVDIGFRGHFSYFSEGNSLQQNVTAGGSSFQVSYDRDINTYDYGVAVVGGVSVAFLRPYVGAGIGSDNINVEYSDVEIPETEDLELEEQDESKFYYNGFIGAELTTIPKIKPFIEYRFEKMQDPVQLKTTAENTNLGQLDDDKGRVILGVILRF